LPPSSINILAIDKPTTQQCPYTAFFILAQVYFSNDDTDMQSIIRDRWRSDANEAWHRGERGEKMGVA